MEKRGQMKLSFGMIFSIILIIIFLSFGFFVIQKFLDMKNSIEIGKFVERFQFDVQKMWLGEQGSQEKEYFLPLKIESVCFVDFTSQSKGENSIKYKKLKQVFNENENLFFYPVGSGNGLDSKQIEHLNLERITETKNPFCIDNLNGKIKITIQKKFGEALVEIAK
jgi:hypothetical protein